MFFRSISLSLSYSVCLPIMSFLQFSFIVIEIVWQFAVSAPRTQSFIDRPAGRRRNYRHQFFFSVFFLLSPVNCCCSLLLLLLLLFENSQWCGEFSIEATFELTKRKCHWNYMYWIEFFSFFSWHQSVCSYRIGPNMLHTIRWSYLSKSITIYTAKSMFCLFIV